jgi:hypothetical protein
MPVTQEAEQAITEWCDSGEAEVWDVAVADGLKVDDAFVGVTRGGFLSGCAEMAEGNHVDSIRAGVAGVAGSEDVE